MVEAYSAFLSQRNLRWDLGHLYPGLVMTIGPTMTSNGYLEFRMDRPFDYSRRLGPGKKFKTALNPTNFPIRAIFLQARHSSPPSGRTIQYPIPITYNLRHHGIRRQKRVRFLQTLPHHLHTISRKISICVATPTTAN